MQLALALNKEYRYRFDKQHDHKSIAVITEIAQYKFERCGLTPFAQAMPEEFKVADDPVAAYRNFYIGDKMRFAKWTKREQPAWITANTIGS